MKKLTILFVLIFFSSPIIAVEKNPCDLEFLDQPKLLACLANMAKRIEQLEADNQKLRLLSKADQCTSETQRHIRSDGTYMRFCNGKDWQVIDARNSKPILKKSKQTYTLAQVAAIGEAYKNNYSSGKRFGQGSVCEVGYHICNFAEALIIQHAYPRSRSITSDMYLRTLGNGNQAMYAGTAEAYNSLFGFAGGGEWDGPALQCPKGSGPLLNFSGQPQRTKGYEFSAGCYKERKKRYWACCINNLD